MGRNLPGERVCFRIPKPPMVPERQACWGLLVRILPYPWRYGTAIPFWALGERLARNVDRQKLCGAFNEATSEMQKRSPTEVC